MNCTNGKIAEQSRNKIARGLLQVMEQYDFKDITVTQIAQEAGLSRKTFYRLFSGKDEVLETILNSLSQKFIAQIKEHELQHYWDVVQEYFNFCEGQKDLLLLLRRNGLLGRMFDLSYQKSTAVFEYVRSKESEERLVQRLPYMLAYSLGGMNSMLFKWIEDDMKIPSSELIAQLKDSFSSSEF